MKKLLGFFRLPMVIAGVILASIAATMLILSFIFFNDYPWVSNVMISASCGIITGWVLYFLANLRTNSYNKIKSEYELLLKARNDALNIVRDSQYYIKCRCLWNEDIGADDFFRRVYEKTESVQSIIFDHIAWELYLEAGFEEDNPLDFAATNNLWNKYIESDDTEGIIGDLLSQNISQLNSLVVKLKEPLQKRKDKLSTYDKYSV